MEVDFFSAFVIVNFFGGTVMLIAMLFGKFYSSRGRQQSGHIFLVERRNAICSVSPV